MHHILLSPYQNFSLPMIIQITGTDPADTGPIIALPEQLPLAVEHHQMAILTAGQDLTRAFPGQISQTDDMDPVGKEILLIPRLAPPELALAPRARRRVALDAPG